MPSAIPHSVSVMFAGGMAGCVCWVATLPFDVIKTRIQASTTGNSSSLLVVGKEVLKEGGIRGLYRGLGPALLRAFPANGACLLGVDLFKQMAEPIRQKLD